MFLSIINLKLPGNNTRATAIAGNKSVRKICAIGFQVAFYLLTEYI